jgi:mRNA interferase MazF
MHDFGDIALTRFPFTDLSGAKVRPTLVVSRDNARRPDVVLAFITSNTTPMHDAVAIAPTATTGLKVPSLVRFDKLATLEKRVVVGLLGRADAPFLAASRPVFFGVFGFGMP